MDEIFGVECTEIREKYEDSACYDVEKGVFCEHTVFQESISTMSDDVRCDYPE